MTTFKFLVQGSSDDYETTFFSDGRNIQATCTCAAGSNGQYCKHRINILKGDKTSILSNNSSEVETLLQVFKDSPLDIKLRQLDSEIQQQEQIKKKVDATKKEVANIMYGK